MIDGALIASAFLLALAGAGHCLGMCSGIGGALTFALPESRRRGAQLWAWQTLFSGGRVLSYTLLGSLAGALGGGLMAHLPAYRMVPMLASGTMMLLLAGWLSGIGGLGFLERAGQRVWRYVQPAVRRLLPVDNAAKTLLVGMAWGLLPCGLVYSALALAATAGNAAGGAAVMLVFGLVTLPTVVSAGVVGGRLGWLRSRGWRITATMLALIMAGWFFAKALHGHHAMTRGGGDVQATQHLPHH